MPPWNLGEIISPIKATRIARVARQHACFPCNSPRACVLNQHGALQHYIQDQSENISSGINPRASILRSIPEHHF